MQHAPDAPSCTEAQNCIRISAYSRRINRRRRRRCRRRLLRQLLVKMQRPEEEEVGFLALCCPGLAGDKGRASIKSGRIQGLIAAFGPSP